MRALLQRVSEARVEVAGEVVGRTGPGLLIFVCALPGDDEETARRLAAKVAKLRIFGDSAGKMNLSIGQVGGSALVVSQFTLAADTRKGNRPSFAGAAPPAEAEALYLAFARFLGDAAIPVETGRFGAAMKVALVNDGPVTLWLDTAAGDGS